MPPFSLPAAGGAAAGGDIRFLVFGDPEEIQAYRDLIAAYGKREGSGDVQLIEASDREDLLTRLSSSFAGGSPPDVFLLNYRFYGQFAARRVLEPVEQRVDEPRRLLQPQPLPALPRRRAAGRARRGPSS